MSIGKIRVTLQCDIEVDEEDLELYEAETLEEAAENLKEWWQEDSSLIVDASESFEVISAEVINL